MRASACRRIRFQRHGIDYAADREPVRIELLNVDCSVQPDGLPEPEVLRRLLEEWNIVVEE